MPDSFFNPFDGLAAQQGQQQAAQQQQVFYSSPIQQAMSELFSHGSFVYKPTPLTPEQEVQRARRNEAFYRMARLEREREVEQEKIEEAEEGVVLNTFLIGCDPEFVALDGANHVINVGHTLQHIGEIGWDHSGNVIEVRPKPAKGAFALVRRMQKLLKDPRLEGLGCAKLRAGAYVPPYLLGGHIHIGGVCSRDQEHLNRITAMDAVTRLLEHLDILPTKECIERRKKGADAGYGKFGAVRYKADGHFEYRTMASWLHDPRVAYICLTAAKLAAVAPIETRTALEKATSFAALQTWAENYKKDDNVKRMLRLFEKGHRSLVKDPDVDFRGRWETLGL